MNPSTRRVTLERQLARYCAQTLPPATRPAQAKRRATLRRRVMRDILRRLRALAVQGHERGWRAVALTAEDEARAAALVGATKVSL